MNFLWVTFEFNFKRSSTVFNVSLKKDEVKKIKKGKARNKN